MALTETLVSGRRVLIKNANSFEGRPDEHTAADVAKSGQGAAGGRGGPGSKPPSKRIFVGNLGYDVTREDLEEQFRPCGEIAMVHVATFEDTGKCKGYAWVTFEELEAAVHAQRGWTMKVEEDDDDAEAEEDEAMEEEDSKPKKKSKGRKWFVNRLRGRQLRCEFAEDAETRYKKRFGKGAKNRDAQEGSEAVEDDTVEQTETQEEFKKPYKAPWKDRKVDARTIAPGAALSRAARGSAAIVEGKGKKTTFD